MSQASADSFDVVVSGGGLVGLTLGVALAQGGLAVAVVDAQATAVTTAPAFDGRVSAIAYASGRMFRALGVWDTLEPDAQPINDIVVSDGRIGRGASPLTLHFDHREIGEPLGHLVENRLTRLALHAAAARTPGLGLIAPETVTGMAADSRSARVRLKGGRQLSARVVVACEGRHSMLREQAGIRSIGWTYGQTGIVTTVVHEKPHAGIAHEYFLPGGPFAILPMTGNRSSLVWTEYDADATRLLARDEAGFAAEMRRRFGDFLGHAEPVGPRFAYPLGLHLARSYCAPRLVLAGDTAHGIHPIAGQGFNLGLRDVAVLAEELCDAARRGEDIGSDAVLARYQQRRRFDTVALAAATDVLNRLFSNDIAPLRVARDLGLAVADRIGPLRRFFMRHAGGDVGDLPRLLRGEAV